MSDDAKTAAPDDATAQRAAREVLDEPIPGDGGAGDDDGAAGGASIEYLELLCARAAETSSRVLARLLEDESVELPSEDCDALGAAWAPVLAELRGVQAPTPLVTALIATAMIAGPRVAPAVVGAVRRRRQARLDAAAEDTRGRHDPSRRAGER